MKHTGKNTRAVCLILSAVFLLSMLFSCGKTEPTKADFTVSFDVNGGTAIKAVTVSKGTAVDLPTPKRAEHEFTGWYLDDTEVSSPFTVNESVTLRAEWKDEGADEYYTVHFNTDGGSYVADVRVVKGQLLELPTEPTKFGCEFECWEDEDGVQYFDSVVLDIAVDEITLKAKWKESEETTSEDETTEDTTEAAETTQPRETDQTTKAPETTAVTGPEITAQPASAEFDTDATITLKVVAKGSGLKYQWYKNGSAVSGATSANLELKGLKAENDGQSFYCEVSNSAGKVTSNTVKISYVPSKPVFSLQPLAQNYDVNETLTFTAKAYGKGVTYQWYQNGIAISGATAASYTTGDLKETDNGAKFCCKATDSAKHTTSSNEVLITLVAGAPRFLIQPVDTEFSAGKSATFTVKVTGTNVKYVWYFDGKMVDGANTNTLTLEGLSIEDGGKEVYCVVSNDKSTKAVTSNKVKLTISETKPAITVQPQNATYAEGGTVTFSVEATGSKLIYQWKKKDPNTGEVSTVTNSTSNTATLIIKNIRPSDTGSLYFCTVRNGKGSVDSKTVTATYVGKPYITKQSPDVVLETKYDSFTLSVTAIGGGAMTYKWYVIAERGNMIPLPDETKNTITIKNKPDTYGSKFKVYCTIVNPEGIENDDTTEAVFNVSIKSAETTASVTTAAETTAAK